MNVNNQHHQLILTKDKLRTLKNKYEELKDTPNETFVFDGQEILVSYAKYLIEYAENQLCK